MSFSNRLHSNLLKKCFPNRTHQQRVSKLLQNSVTAKPKRLSQSHQALLQSDPEMKFPNRLHSKLPKKRFPNRPHQQRVSKLLQNTMTAKPKLLSQSHQALLQSDPEMKFPSRLHSKLPKKCFPNRPHQQRVSKHLQNRMTAKAKRLSQSHQALLQSDPGMSFSNRLHSNLLKKCFPNRPHQQRVSKLLQNSVTAKAKLLSQSHQALLQSDPGMSFSNRLHSKLPKKRFPNRPHQQRVSTWPLARKRLRARFHFSIFDGPSFGSAKGLQKHCRIGGASSVGELSPSCMWKPAQSNYVGNFAGPKMVPQNSPCSSCKWLPRAQKWARLAGPFLGPQKTKIWSNLIKTHITQCATYKMHLGNRGGPSDNGYGILMLSRPRNGAGQKQTWLADPTFLFQLRWYCWCNSQRVSKLLQNRMTDKLTVFLRFWLVLRILRFLRSRRL